MYRHLYTHVHVHVCRHVYRQAVCIDAESFDAIKLRMDAYDKLREDMIKAPIRTSYLFNKVLGQRKYHASLATHHRQYGCNN